jgi:hypothetical protein
MRRLRQIVLRYRYGLWVLTAAVVVLLAAPLHLHLHHVDHHGAAATHTSDLHLDDGIGDHDHHRDSHIVDLSADTVVKKSDVDTILSGFVACLLVLLLLPFLRRLPLCPSASRRPGVRSFLIAPPLRAPPHY